MSKLMAAVIFGGQSSEHEVSCVTAQTFIKAIDKEKYDLLLIGITKEGKWLKAESLDVIADGTWYESDTQAIITPDKSIHGAILVKEGKAPEFVRIDVALPAMHGMWGEDGTIQGVFEMANIPYVGCGVLASAVAMDKFYTKIVATTTGVRQAAYTPVFGEDIAKDLEAEVRRVENERTYPVFVKPSRAGSSQGISKATNSKELADALLLAAKHDRKILVEEQIIGREIECAVLGNYDPKASDPGEVVAGDAWYSYEAKYNNADSKTIVNPELPGNAAETVREYAVKIYKALDCTGLSRVDFFVQEDGGVVFNEINTMPGHTAISMYPMLWTAKGVDIEKETEELIRLAMERMGQ